MKIALIISKYIDVNKYESDHPNRIRVLQILHALLEKYKELYGPNIKFITGISVGFEQDFCKLCIETKTKFSIYLPFEGQESAWPKPIQNEVTVIKTNAINVKMINHGKYSPTKFIAQTTEMLKDANIAILIASNKKDCALIESSVKYLNRAEKEYIKIQI